MSEVHIIVKRFLTSANTDAVSVISHQISIMQLKRQCYVFNSNRQQNINGKKTLKMKFSIKTRQ